MTEEESQDVNQFPSLTSTDELAKNEKGFHELGEFDVVKLELGKRSGGSIPTIPISRIMGCMDSMISLCKPYKVRCPLVSMFDVWSPAHNNTLDPKDRKKYVPKKMNFRYDPQFHDIFNTVYKTCQKVMENALAMHPGMEKNTDISNPMNFDNADAIEKSLSMKIKEVDGGFAPDFYQIVRKDGSKKIKPIAQCPQIFPRGTIFYITFVPERLHITRNDETMRDVLGMTLTIDSMIVDGAGVVPTRRIYTDEDLQEELSSAMFSDTKTPSPKKRSQSPPETPKKKRQKRYRSDSEGETSD